MPKRRTRRPPKVGMTFRRRYKGRLYHVRIVRTRGRVGYQVRGKLYATPTAAAKSITGTDVNGWTFWRIDPVMALPLRRPQDPPRRSVPRVGSTYARMYKGRRYVVEVVRTERGLGWQVNGQVYASPSGAARAVTGTAINGWAFWRID